MTEMTAQLLEIGARLDGRDACARAEHHSLAVLVELGAACSAAATAAAFAEESISRIPGREARDHVAAVRGDDQLLFDASCGPAVGGGPERLEREHHALLDDLRVF